MEKSKSIRSLIIIFVVLTFVPFFLLGCSGGGGGSSTPRGTDKTLGTLSSSNSSDSTEVVTALSSVYVGIVAGGGSTGSAPTAQSADGVPPTIFDALENIIDRMAREVQKGDVEALGAVTDIPFNELCTTGTATLSMDWDDIADGCYDMRNIHMTVSMSSCLDDIGDTTTGTMEVTIPGSSCVLMNGNPSEMNMVLDMILVEASPGSTIDFGNFSMQVSGLLWDPEGDIESMDALLDGSMTIDNESVSFDDFNLSVIDDNTDPTASSVTMNGYILCSCINGWVEVTTQSAVKFPDDFSCPNGGQYTIRASNATAVVTIDSDTSIDVSMDGVIVHSYDSCDDPDIPTC